jgi:hypothetical protein
VEFLILESWATSPGKPGYFSWKAVLLFLESWATSHGKLGYFTWKAVGFPILEAGLLEASSYLVKYFPHFLIQVHWEALPYI